MTDEHRPARRRRGGGWGALVLCVALLAAAALAAWNAPRAESHERAWETAAHCTAATPAADRTECLTHLPAVIESTDPNRPKKNSWLYFTHDRPLHRLGVSQEAALEFRAGDRVRLTVWRRQIMEVTGERHRWRTHVPGGNDMAVGAALLALFAGFPAARLVMRLRGRRRPAEETLPSTLPFNVTLVATAAWLLPLCYMHATTLLTTPTPVTVVWATVGTLSTTMLLVWSWRATRIRPPEAPPREPSAATDEETFLPARFLEATDYNPHHFGTHIVIGAGRPPAVTPHPGPDRFAAKPIPAHRLTLRQVRRARESDGAIPGTWHVAELDDAGTPVRLAASPADLPRILAEITATVVA